MRDVCRESPESKSRYPPQWETQQKHERPRPRRSERIQSELPRCLPRIERTAGFSSKRLRQVLHGKVEEHILRRRHRELDEKTERTQHRREGAKRKSARDRARVSVVRVCAATRARDAPLALPDAKVRRVEADS